LFALGLVDQQLAFDARLATLAQAVVGNLEALVGQFGRFDQQIALVFEALALEGFVLAQAPGELIQRYGEVSELFVQPFELVGDGDECSARREPRLRLDVRIEYHGGSTPASVRIGRLY